MKRRAYKKKEIEGTPSIDHSPYEPKLTFPRLVYTKTQKKGFSKFKKGIGHIGISWPKNDDLT